MASSYTPLLRLTLPTTGELQGTWGDTVNNGITSLTEAAIAGTAAIVMSDANHTLTVANGATDEARRMFVTLTGALTATRNVICPAVSKMYVVRNNTTGGQSIVFKTSAGTGITVANGQSALLYCDGTNVVEAFSAFGGNAATATALQTTRTLWGQNFNGTANVTGNLSSVGNITGTASVTITATNGSLGLAATGTGNPIQLLTNSIERMRIDSAGNVGIGTTLAASPGLALADSLNINFAEVAGASYANIFRQANSADLVLGSGVRYSSTANSFASSIGAAWARTAISVGYGAIKFLTAPEAAISPGASATLNEHMRIDSAGKVGIGTSSPATKLDVNGDGTFRNGNGVIVGTVSNAAGWFDFGGSSNVSGAQMSHVNTLRFLTASTERMRLDSSGNLGLGVTPSGWASASKAFQIKGTGSSIDGAISAGNGTNALVVSNNAYYNAGWKYVFSGSHPAGRYDIDTGTHAWYTAPSGTAGNPISFTQAMTLDASGNLGIGTSSPTSPIHVQRSNDGVIGTFRGTSSAQLLLSVSGGNLIYDASNGNATHVWRANNTERARIDANGRFLIGTTNSIDGRLSVVADTGNSGCIATGNNGLPVYYPAYFYHGASLVGNISCNSTNTAYTTSSDYRLKENIQDVTGSGAFIDALQPRTWNWKVNGSVGTGFIAHELQTVSPSSVTGTKDAVDAEGRPVYQAVEYGSAEVIAMLVAEVKSLRQRITALEAK
jgi:hypothetical protein